MKEVLARLQQMNARRKSAGIDPPKNPAQLPKTDLDARILPNKEGGYAPNDTPLAVNEILNGFIVDSDVVIGNVEHCCMTDMLETIAADHAVDVTTVMADSAYSCGETPFAVLKVHFDLRRFLLRGIAGVQTEWSWACAAFNLKKLMTLIARLRAAAEVSGELATVNGT